MSTRNASVRALSALVFSLLAAPSPAGAKPKASSRACVEAYEEAQVLRKSAELLSAKEQLLVCAEERCGGFIHRECSQWLEQLNGDMPSVVFTVTDGAGQPLSEVEVSMDGALVASALQGTPVAVDPGLHDFSFKAKGHDAVSRKVMIVQGEQERSIAVSLGQQSKEPAQSADGESARGEGRSALPYVIGSVGVLGVVGFAVLGTLGTSEHEKLPRCWPDCSRSQIDRVNTLYLAANVSLGVGAVGLGTAAVLFLTEGGSEPSNEEKPDYALDVRRTQGGMFAEVSGRF